MKDCIYEKIPERIHCSVCFADSGLVMKALRKGGKLVGHVWLCQQHARQISSLAAEFTPVYKSITPSAIAA